MKRVEPTRPRSTVALATLRQQIQRGDFANGAVLPGERDLAHDLGVSRTTLRNALATLVAEGILAQRRGFGTVVASDAGDTGPAQRLSDQARPLLGLGDELLARHEHLTISESTNGTYLALPDEVLTFRILPQAEVRRARRVLQETGGEVVAIERISVPLALMAGDAPPGHWLTRLQQGGKQVDRITRRIRVASSHETPPVHRSYQTNGMVTEQLLFDRTMTCLIAWHLWQPCTRIDSIVSWSVHAAEDLD